MAARSRFSSQPREFELTDAEYMRICQLVRRYTGISLSANKRELIYGRLARRLRHLGLDSFTAYCSVLESEDADELQELTNAMTTNLTSFFREGHHFAQLAREVLPAVRTAKAASRRLRFWSAGCSTGEEAYSIAMTTREVLPDLRGWDARILATDIDSNVLERASAGRYQQEQLRGLTPQRCARWFQQSEEEAETFRAVDDLRRMVTFKQLNLLQEWRMKGPFDAIFCRNVVIYFDKSVQRALFERMAALQEPGAWLFVGHSENLQNITPLYRSVGRTAYQRV
jgi:chemotaxis protein methyltransferase CheR